MDVSGDSFARLADFYRADVTELYSMAKEGQVNTPPNSWAETWDLALRDEGVEATSNAAREGKAAVVAAAAAEAASDSNVDAVAPPASPAAKPQPIVPVANVAAAADTSEPGAHPQPLNVQAPYVQAPYVPKLGGECPASSQYAQLTQLANRESRKPKRFKKVN